MKELVIAPSILSLDYSRTSEQLKELDESNAKWMHFDVMDGHLYHIHNFQIMRIAFPAYRPILNSSTYGTIRFIDMNTIAESACILNILKIRYAFGQLRDIHRNKIQ